VGESVEGILIMVDCSLPSKRISIWVPPGILTVGNVKVIVNLFATPAAFGLRVTEMLSAALTLLVNVREESKNTKTKIK
jgi:hypothetical protein